MSFFTWDANKYSVKVKAMDDEHIELIRIMNSLYDLVDKKASKADLSKVLKQLGDYTVKHFKDEEAFFEKLPDYPQAEVHKQIHKDLLAKFTDHAKKFETTGELKADFFNFLKVWLTAHMTGIDLKYGEVSQKKAS